MWASWARQGAHWACQALSHNLPSSVIDAPLRVPPDSCLAPQWYRLEDKNKKKDIVEVMMSFWMGTLVDEAFSGAWQSDSTIINNDGVALTRSQQYYSPRLWYLRVNVIQAQDLVLRDKNMKT